MHPPYSSVFVTEFNLKYGNTDLLFWLRKRSSPKYGNAHGHLNIFFTVVSGVKNVAPSVGKGVCSYLLCSMPGHVQYTLGPVTCIDNVVDNDRVEYHQMASYFKNKRQGKNRNAKIGLPTSSKPQQRCARVQLFRDSYTAAWPYIVAVRMR